MTIGRGGGLYMIIGKSNDLDSPHSDYLAMIYSSVLILKKKKKNPDI